MATALLAASGTGDVALSTTPTNVVGFNFTETAGTPAVATVTLKDGENGNTLVTIELAANASVFEMWDAPLVFHSGVYLDRTAGESTVAVYTL